MIPIFIIHRHIYTVALVTHINIQNFRQVIIISRVLLSQADLAQIDSLDVVLVDEVLRAHSDDEEFLVELEAEVDLCGGDWTKLS